MRTALAVAAAPVYRLTMRISDVVRRKGDEVVTVRSDETVERLLQLLADHRIGAVVVSDDGEGVTGIVSERDIVRHLHSDGPDVVKAPISSIMTSEVQTCDLDVPIEGRLRAIVSIGDIVKHRIDELQAERDQLVGYIQQ